MDKNKIQSLRAEAEALLAKITNRTTQPEAPVVSSVPAIYARSAMTAPKSTQKGLAVSPEALAVHQEFVDHLESVNKRQGLQVRGVQAPSLRTMETRILPLLGDIVEVRQFYGILRDCRWRAWRTVAFENGRRLVEVEYGTSWSVVIRLMEAGETLDAVEAVYTAHARMPNIAVTALLELLHDVCRDDFNLFQAFIELFEPLYLEVKASQQPKLFSRQLHRIAYECGGSVEEWLTLQESSTLHRTPVQRAERTSSMPSLVRLREEFSYDMDEENARRRGNFDLAFDPDKNKIRGSHI